MLRDVKTAKDLSLLTQVIKTVHDQELLCFALRGDEEIEKI